jgi:hypothetical protein
MQLELRRADIWQLHLGPGLQGYSFMLSGLPVLTAKGVSFFKTGKHLIVWCLIIIIASCANPPEERHSLASGQKLTFQLADSQVLAYPIHQGKYRLPLLTAGYPYFLHGKVYYIHFGTGIISVFDQKGHLLAELGGAGNAPGNLSGNPLILALSHGHVLAYDPMLQQVAKFDSANRFVHSKYLLKSSSPRELHAYVRNLGVISPGFSHQGKLYFPTYGLGLSMRHLPKMYEQPVMSEFDENYLLRSSFGRYDPVYRNARGTLPYACETLVALNPVKNEILVTFSATAHLYVFDAGDQQLKYTLVPAPELKSRLKQNFVYLTQDGIPPDGRKLSIFLNLVISPNGKLALSTVGEPEGNKFVAYDSEYHLLGLFPFPLANAPVVCHVDNDFIYFLGRYDEVKATRTIYRYKYRVE